MTQWKVVKKAWSLLHALVIEYRTQFEVKNKYLLHIKLSLRLKKNLLRLKAVILEKNVKQIYNFKICPKIREQNVI